MLPNQQRSVQTQTELSGYLDIETLLIEKGVNAPAELIDLIVQVVKKVPSLNEATLVNLANHLNITMFGREISDKVTQNTGRKIYNLHPYRKAGSGAVCMATYTDTSGQHFVLLGQKKPRAQLIDSRLILPGGYFQPYPLLGHVEGVEKLTAEQKDEIEEAIRFGMLNAYKKMAVEEKMQARIIPDQEAPASKLPTFDLNVEACAKRELKEETGLTDINPQFLMEQSSYPDTNPDLHAINLSYLFDCGSQNTAPEAKAGSDLAKLQWVQFSDLEVKQLGAQTEYSLKGETIRKDHGPVLEEGARVLIDKQIQKNSKGLLTLVTLEKHLESQALKAKKTFSALLGNKPGTYLGQAAAHYYNKLAKLAEDYSNYHEQNTVFSFAQLEASLVDKKPSRTKNIAAWCSLFTLAAGAGVLACKLYQGGQTPSLKR